MTTWLDVTKSDYPALRANVLGVPGGVLTEQMLIDGAVAFRKYVEAAQQQRIAMTPWLSRMSTICVWLYEQERAEDAVRLAFLVGSVSEFGAINQSGLDFMRSVESEWEAAC